MGTCVHELVPGLVLCDLQAVASEQLKETHVFVSVCKSDVRQYDIFLKPVRDRLHVVGGLTGQLAATVAAIERALRGGRRVAVFCETGRQRSPTVGAAFLVACAGLSAKGAVACVRSKHPLAFVEGCAYADALAQLEAGR